jgi:hypothetical protein
LIRLSPHVNGQLTKIGYRFGHCRWAAGTA